MARANYIILLLLMWLILTPGVLHASWSPDPGISGFSSVEMTPDTITDDIKLGRNIMYRKGKADAYLMIAEMEEEKNQLARALKYYFSAIYELEILEDSLRIADTKAKIGAIFKANNLHDKALEYYKASELIILRRGIMEDHTSLLIEIGEVYYAMKNYSAALQYFSRAGEIFRRNGETGFYILSTFKMVQCFNALEQYDKALELNYTILKHYQDQGDIAKEIIILNNIGFTFKYLGNNPEALNYFKKAGDLEKQITGYQNPMTLVNQAIVYQNMGENSMAIRLLNEASQTVDKLENDRLAAEYHHLTALVYFNLKDYHNALIYNKACIKLAETGKHIVILDRAWLLSSRINEAIYNYEDAMVSFQKHLVISDSLQRSAISSQQDLNQTAFLVEQITRETDSLWAAEELSYLELQRLKLDSANRQQELQILYKADSIQRITIQNQRLENQRARQALLLKEEQVYAAKKAKEVDSLRTLEKLQSLELERQQLVQKEQQSQIEIAALQLRKVQTRNKWLAGFGALAIIIIYLVIRGLRYARKTNRVLTKQKNEIERQKDEIEYERERSDKLLLNILPEETAEELKEKGSATPKHYDMVSVLFTDFKGFTNIAEKLTPQELVAELNNCFLEFDKIIDKHNLEKIKTIGDAYMCAGGIPVANTTNPFDIVEAGLEIKAFMEKLKADREASGMDFWELRIGVHTGPVIAGVVGKNKFAYDIWGDAVNTASRMESSGIPGKVNISGETYKLVKEKFICTHRGKIQAKNKGEIDMYIVEGQK